MAKGSDAIPQVVDDYIRTARTKPGEFLFAAPCRQGSGLSTRQYARLVGAWIRGVGLDPRIFGSHSLRRAKATLIYRHTGNLCAVQLLLGKAPFVTSASRSMTLWRRPNKSTGDANRHSPAPAIVGHIVIRSPAPASRCGESCSHRGHHLVAETDPCRAESVAVAAEWIASPKVRGDARNRDNAWSQTRSEGR
jgi:hypothetical protein